MYRTCLNAFLLTFLVLVAGFTVCSGNNGTSQQTGDGSGSTIEKTSLEKGMEPIYNLLHGFLDTVMPHNFYSQDDSPFSVQDLDKIIKDSDFGKLQERWQDLFSTFGGFAACFILGLLFVIFFPIITGCFCCCFCCCKNCGGGKGKYDSSKRSSCLRVTCAGFLLLFTTLMLAGGIITFLGAELFNKALKNENNEGVLGHVDNSLHALQTFSTDTVTDLKKKTKDEVEGGLNKIEKEVKDTVEKVVTKVENTINATTILDQTEYLGNASLKISEDLKNINSSILELRRLQTEVTQDLSNINTTINTHCTPPSCNIDTSQLNFNPDFTTLDELQSQASDITKSQNITKLISDAKSKFDNVKADVDREVASNIQSATNKTKEIKAQLNSELMKVDNASVPFNNSLQEGRQFIRDNQKDIAKISDYIWYGCIGVGCTIMLLVFFYYMGVLFGICGERPGRNAACCNRGTGANLLYFGVFVSSVFSWIVMLLVAVMFLTGGLTYTMFCRYVDDGVENVGTFETVVQDSLGWNVSQAFGVKDLSVSGMFQNCKENQAIYTALHFDSLFNIDDIVNVSNIQKEVSDMTNVSFTLGNITLMTTELENQLTDFLNAGLQNISFGNYSRELEKPITGSGVPLTDLATDLENVAANFPAGPTKDGLNGAAHDLRTLENTTIRNVETEKRNLEASLNDLEKHVDLTQQVNTLINGINAAQYSYNSQKNQIVKQSLREATDVIKTLINTTVDNALSMVKNDIGKCRPLYDAAQSVVDATCDMGVDSFNAIWFGLGWAAFFYIPCFICAAILAALYMKIGSYIDHPKHDQFDDPNHETYNGYMGANQDDIPLTSQQRMQDHINGKFNGAYNRNEGIELRRDPRSSGYGYDPHQGHGSGYHDDGYGSPERLPPSYDDLNMQDYSGRAEGGYPKSHHY